MKLITPQLPLTVPLDLWEAMAMATSPEYADSYLSGAEVHNGRLLPRTKIGWTRLRDNGAAMHALRRNNITLIEPPLYQANQMLQMADSRGRA